MAYFMQKEAEREKRAGTKGALRRAAQRAGETTREFADQHKHSKGKVGKRSRLALVFMNANHDR